MAHYCLRDDRQLKSMGYMEILGEQVTVCECPGCGEITFWRNHEEVKKSVEQVITQAVRT